VRAWLDLWQLPHHPARPLLLFRGICALLAFDAWTLMLEHGGRYSVGAFNVAHFDLVDRLVPMPSPALYLGLVCCAGCYAFVGALGSLRRAEALLLWILYTLAWMLSMHDSYQHHYLLSWLLGFALVAPILSVSDCLRSDARMRESSFPLVLSCCATVYLFTAISKSSELWLSGAVLKKLATEGGPMAWGPEALRLFGVDETSTSHLAVILIVTTQLVIALGFVAAFLRDAQPSPLLALACWLSLLAASSFHLATELSPSFAIGWFSYYMIWTVWISLLPASWLALLMRLIERFRTLWCRFVTAYQAKLEQGSSSARFAAASTAFRRVALWLSPSVALIYLLLEDLPGLGIAVLAFSCAISLRVWFERRAATHSTLLPALLPLTAVVALSLTLSLTHVRFDYYRRAAGELSRMGRREEALDLYRQAEAYAPSGESRRPQIEGLERQLADPSSE
jgi:hypothetical protein